MKGAGDGEWGAPLLGALVVVGRVRIAVVFGVGAAVVVVAWAWADATSESRAAAPRRMMTDDGWARMLVVVVCSLGKWSINTSRRRAVCSITRRRKRGGLSGARAWASTMQTPNPPPAAAPPTSAAAKAEEAKAPATAAPAKAPAAAAAAEQVEQPAAAPA